MSVLLFSRKAWCALNLMSMVFLFCLSSQLFCYLRRTFINISIQGVYSKITFIRSRQKLGELNNLTMLTGFSSNLCNVDFNELLTIWYLYFVFQLLCPSNTRFVKFRCTYFMFLIASKWNQHTINWRLDQLYHTVLTLKGMLCYIKYVRSFQTGGNTSIDRFV